jgi:hypothetical protein
MCRSHLTLTIKPSRSIQSVDLSELVLILAFVPTNMSVPHPTMKYACVILELISFLNIIE